MILDELAIINALEEHDDPFNVKKNELDGDLVHDLYVKPLKPVKREKKVRNHYETDHYHIQWHRMENLTSSIHSIRQSFWFDFHFR